MCNRPRLLAEIRSAAQAEHRSVDKVLTDAVKRYVEERSWTKLLEFGEERARALGVKESDIDRPIASAITSPRPKDADDDRILECAAAAKSDFIVSEDKNLLRPGQFGNARIVSITDFEFLHFTD